MEKTTKFIKSKIDYQVLYLPTYRRIENKFAYSYDSEIMEREYSRRSILKKTQSIRNNIIAATGMADVENLINEKLEELIIKAEKSATDLNIKCFKDILMQETPELVKDDNILSENEINKVFESIDEKEFKKKELNEIRKSLSRIKTTNMESIWNHDNISYYFYSNLRQRFLQIQEDEKPLVNFFNACNNYLSNKKIIYDEKSRNYQIIVTDGNKHKNISMEDLSSGEKQVVALFSYIYLVSNKKILLLIDEPELSLSVIWQKKFLIDLIKGPNCCGLIAVTHSPFVIDNELFKFAHSLEESIK